MLVYINLLRFWRKDSILFLDYWLFLICFTFTEDVNFSCPGPEEEDYHNSFKNNIKTKEEVYMRNYTFI